MAAGKADNKLDVKLRPAWINYWSAFLAIIFLVLLSIIVAIVGGPGGVIGAIIGLLCAVVILAGTALRRYSWKFTIDHNRVARHYGLISRNQQSVRIRDLRSVEFNQTLIQRIVGIGDLSFYSAGSSKAEVQFFGISHPLQWRDKIDRAMDEIKSEANDGE